MVGNKVGVVVIGRNEGERLKRCLLSVLGAVAAVVYVDSGSTDGSVALAGRLGAEVLALDMAMPFTAARARNEGFDRLRALLGTVEFVQFVDGDCEVVQGWLSEATVYLQAQPNIAVVCGRLRERFPQQSVYNGLCDIEWDTPTGEARSCGGIAMFRATAFSAASGYRAELIAGEEPELCVRLRTAGWKIWRLDAEMALHDAAMTRFGQWWRRAVRGGHAYAEGARLHGAPPERHCVRESRRIWVWGLGLPVAVLAGLAFFGWGGLLLLAFYPLQIVHLAYKGKRSTKQNWIHAFFLVLIKFPELQGQMTFWWRKVVDVQSTLIEYK
ncbi:MAG: glycosyltransferase [Methylophilaceae bacterium]|nr:glycosyltransferase [Methylophilaceae bacterium]